MAEIETLAELKSGNLFVEAVKGHKGVYFALSKNEQGMCLTLLEASALHRFIIDTIKGLPVDALSSEFQNFDSEPE